MVDKKGSLSDALKKLEKIALWFEEQEDLDVQQGIEKVKEGAELIKSSKKQLASIENEFIEVKKSLEE